MASKNDNTNPSDMINEEQGKIVNNVRIDIREIEQSSFFALVNQVKHNIFNQSLMLKYVGFFFALTVWIFTFAQM